jgi:hypothetical protein
MNDYLVLKRYRILNDSFPPCFKGEGDVRTEYNSFQVRGCFVAHMHILTREYDLLPELFQDDRLG